ncbi:hypothetical protein VKA52_14405 [Halobacillus sp. HZG1]|uniref:hypothetical protein n=1 Tax=Halobacillus sp. HZG1 TaxID=3111769 RepID=UPI002DB8E37F|nr:hypothetical protein [Halobacillus sp. HZG1]MEC3884924.1 hypothetical protein [Halobacillus sp. HZG1]
MKDGFKHYFWKRFWLIFVPLYLMAIGNESYIVSNSFSEFEDYASFLYFLVFYFIGYGAITAGILHLFWRAGRNLGVLNREEKFRE